MFLLKIWMHWYIYIYFFRITIDVFTWRFEAFMIGNFDFAKGGNITKYCQVFRRWILFFKFLLVFFEIWNASQRITLKWWYWKNMEKCCYFVTYTNKRFKLKFWKLVGEPFIYISFKTILLYKPSVWKFPLIMI